MTACYALGRLFSDPQLGSSSVETSSALQAPGSRIGAAPCIAACESRHGQLAGDPAARRLSPTPGSSLRWRCWSPLRQQSAAADSSSAPGCSVSTAARSAPSKRTGDRCLELGDANDCCQRCCTRSSCTLVASQTATACLPAGRQQTAARRTAW
jgi:hypothetical protein